MEYLLEYGINPIDSTSLVGGFTVANYAMESEITATPSSIVPDKVGDISIHYIAIAKNQYEN